MTHDITEQQKKEQREHFIQNWLVETLQTYDFHYQFVIGDASFRRYARVNVQNNTYMLMDAPPDKENCRPFVQIDEFLDGHGVHVPRIIAKNLEQGLLLLEDFGDVMLSQVLNRDTVDAYYLQCFKQLIHLQKIDAAEQLPLYSAEKLQEEMYLMMDWLLPDLNIKLNDDEKNVVTETFRILVHSALAQPQVIIHRDFHSRNLMRIAGQEELGIIDFQDAVIGADTYDLISLVRDAYVHWSEEQVIRWIEQFYELLPATAKQNRSFVLFKQQADYMALQRHLKILGIFVRLFKRDGKAGYLKDLPLVMWYVRHLSGKYTELALFKQLLEDKIVPVFQQKYGEYINPYAV